MKIAPGRLWRWARRLSQCIAVVAIVAAPVLGGWQRLDRAEMAVWDDLGWNLPEELRDSLPLGDSPKKAYESLYLVGGGVGVDYFGLPSVDPVVGAVAVLRSQMSLRFIVALAVPLLLALLLGRVFCGWLCPFGVLARGVDILTHRLPWKRRPYALPSRRPVRWLLLGATVLLSVLGFHVFLFLVLPHLVLQQSVYAMWLLGGGGVIIGVLLGLLVAGVIFGPTLYCAALCPTGALLSLVGRKKIVRVTVETPTDCGQHCVLCNNACWLQLNPASGDPGPDCDSCARCFTACPRLNMRIAVAEKRPKRKHLPVVTALLLGLGAVLGGTRPADAQSEIKPEIILEGELQRADVRVAVALVDLSGVKLDLDASDELFGTELSVYVTRGRDKVYRGPLSVRIGDRIVAFKAPTAPLSTPNRAIYRSVLREQIDPGTEVVVEAIPGWLDKPAEWRTPSRGVSREYGDTAMAAMTALLVFGGLMCLALAVPEKGEKFNPEK